MTEETKKPCGHGCKRGECVVCTNVNNPKHYGGKDNPYEAIKVIEAWDLGYNLGNTVKYIARNGKKENALQDLEKAKWYIEREISKLKGQNPIDEFLQNIGQSGQEDAPERILIAIEAFEKAAIAAQERPVNFTDNLSSLSLDNKPLFLYILTPRHTGFQYYVIGTDPTDAWKNLNTFCKNVNGEIIDLIIDNIEVVGELLNNYIIRKRP